ncbi:hypothetical protein K3495_g9454 [Podosphaera aphanis]|nr:hypothetical protein K3495_g9454 [Podosphaera aphanis]
MDRKKQRRDDTKNHALYFHEGNKRSKILEKGWMESERTKNKTKYIREGKLVSALIFSDFTKKAQKSQQGLILASISISDINKALQKLNKQREKPTIESIGKKFHKQLIGFETMFLEDESSELPPHRIGHDMEINLEKDENGNEKKPPYGPLYEMSREELLVLQKTLADLLDKGWIRASSSLASSPVLFARKPRGGLSFCVDYRGLNAITKKDRHLLPIIRETLRQSTKAR